MCFGGVKPGKAYVSFHLMPLYSTALKDEPEGGNGAGDSKEYFLRILAGDKALPRFHSASVARPGGTWIE